MKIVAWVPIKLNNERLPNKNILTLGDKPVCMHLLETLLKTKYIDEIIVYCSDTAIKQYLPEGIKLIIREKYLDGFDVKHMEIVNHFINDVNADIYVNAHVTSPFLPINAFETGISKVLSGIYDSAYFIQEIRQFCWLKQEPLNFNRQDIPRTQDLEPVLVDCGVTICKRSVYTEQKARFGNKPYFVTIDTLEAIDIDYPEDFKIAEAIYEKIIKLRQ